MKKYLTFQTDGTILESEIKTIDIINNNYSKYEFKNNYYVLIIEENENLNISKIPFLNINIHGIIKMFRVNNFSDLKLKSLSESFYFKNINTNIEYIEYSSDDFNPDTCDEDNTC